MLRLTENFKEHYSRFLDWEKFEKILGTPLRKSIRVNTLKISPEILVKRLSDEWLLEKILWYRDGFFISHRTQDRRDIGNIEEHDEGLFYIQEAASMLPPLVLDPKPDEFILDMCASPGSKTTQIAQMMQNKGKIIASDIREDRIAILKRNIKRMGVKNCKVLMQAGQHFKDLKFDKILVDAPCSGTGTMRMQDELENFSPEIAKRMSFEQRSLLHSAFCVLRKDGILVYSTCSLEIEENEAVVDWLLKRHKKTELEEIEIPKLKRSDALLEWNNEKFDPRIGRCLRIAPYDNNTSGFFVAKIRKL